MYEIVPGCITTEEFPFAEVAATVIGGSTVGGASVSTITKVSGTGTKHTTHQIIITQNKEH